jgi:hypothetical protein
MVTVEGVLQLALHCPHLPKYLLWIAAPHRRIVAICSSTSDFARIEARIFMKFICDNLPLGFYRAL